MKLVRRLLTHHQLANILFAVVLVMGAMSYFSLPRQQDPEVNFNWVNVSTILPGASAEDVERLVTSPLEDALRNVQDIRFVSSTSRESLSNLTVRFNDVSERVFDKRVSDLRREIQNKTNEELPEEAEDPFIFEATTSSGFPTALVVVAGQADDESLRRQGRLVKDDLERIAGVDRVQAFGLHEPELHVEFDPVATAARGLDGADLADALGRSFRDVFAGTARVAAGEWLVRVDGTTSDPERLAEVQVAPPLEPSARVRLDTVARIERGREDPAQLVAFDGRPAVSLSVTKIPKVNTLKLVGAINAYIERKNSQLAGSGIDVILADDQTIPTREAIDIMQTNAALGLTLVLAVCWAFLGLRIAVLVTLGILFSIAGTFWLLAATGNTLNVSVLLGIVIVLGMLVDDAVVVVEAIYYRIQRGAEALGAALAGLREVAQPVTSAVSTTMAAFLPLMLLGGILGQFMFVIPLVVTLGLATSLIEAFWILPSHLIDWRGRHGHRERAGGRRARFIHWLRVNYTKWLCYVIRRPKRFMALFVFGFAAAVGVVGVGLIRINFFTFDPVRLFYVNVDMPPTAPLEESLRQALAVERRVRAHLGPDEVRAITVLAGLKFTEVEPLFGDQFAQLQVSLNPIDRGSGRQVNEVVEAMRADVAATPGDGEISFLEISGGPPATKPISVKVRSDDFGELRSAADRVTEIAAAVPGVRDLSDDDIPGRAELALEVDHAATRRLGLDPGHVARLLRLHLDGEVVAFMRDEGEKVELRVRAQPRRLDRVDAILDDPIRLPDGTSTTFAALVTASTRQGKGTIRHYNLRRAITVEADLDDELNNTVAANAEIRRRWQEVQAEFPNTDLDFSGELDDIQDTLDSLPGLFLLGLGLIYLILATQFRSYFQPLLILVTVPMAFTGVVFGLLVTGNPMSLYMMYGVIALTGIAVNSAIVLIDAANQRIRAGMRPLHATVYAARRRVVPVIMTTSTTIAGLFSLALGLGGKSLLWGPVASSIVAGLGVATVLTLFVVPTLYRLFMRGHGEHQRLEGRAAAA